MEFTIIENGERVKYLREGSCNLCGLCCCKNVIGVKITAGCGNEHNEIETNWSDWEGYSEFSAQGINWWVKLDVRDEMREKPCLSLVDGRCSTWKDDDWLAVCRYFPVHPKDIEKFPECTFSFREIGEEE